MKILNLYAGIGGNRTLWGDKHEITAVEIDPQIAEIYKKRFPNDRSHSSKIGAPTITYQCPCCGNEDLWINYSETWTTGHPFICSCGWSGIPHVVYHYGEEVI